ncbi:uncharacterized protein C4orf19 homolog isoform X1 [Tupaia chinensis]|uniref:uncharacterized protein C4orf19 homolog isoform X2 n=1 Tax=Tupaia chinensis TaxID=246437 RepID=UPI0003C8E8B6|nr:uncharacterized protein C4orf19 homolog isoform X2 [Tupaia chinensis]XP_006169319.1 uncharacterized protein C4orf19 homolog isoform X1 [Tupaia chinensis]XP_006169320.1 uncharacterized protein C4orf19 homolog isoform X1 [Tupaia chinensis]XP_006169321.1 uncharacterized protein C4orf19 homolog isoform X1 [Tupaia chinensis]XP_014439933.1 uncharacterized protein C4orf19 homolog isoform X1 [Tupaia chinensis]
MGCRCCKMIQSYLFDPVQVPSPGYVNEVNSCKLDEDHTVKLKGKQSSQVLVHKNDLQRESLKRTESRGRTAGPQEPCWSHQGLLPQGDAGGGHCAGKTDGAINGISPTAALQPTGTLWPHQDDRGSWASTANSIHPTQPFLEGGGSRKWDCMHPASEETQVIQHGDSRTPAKAERLDLEVQDHVLQIPAPDYPQIWGPAAHNTGHEEKDCLFQNPAKDESPEGIHPRVGKHGLNIPFSMKRSWDSLNEAVATEVLNVCFKEKDPAQALPVVDSGPRWEGTHGSSQGRDGEMGDEDAAVAEALAALEAATAGEDVDEAD